MPFWRIALVALVGFWTVPLGAAPQSYTLKIDDSRIGFTYNLQGSEFQGEIPIAAADVVIDFDNLSRSQVFVTFDMAGTSAGFGPLTEAVRSKAVLSTAQNPQATFETSRVTRSGVGATLEGNLTLRGVVRPVTLDARIYRERGSDVGDLSNLVLHITGHLDRNEFGASGYANLVGPKIGLNVVVSVAAE